MSVEIPPPLVTSSKFPSPKSNETCSIVPSISVPLTVKLIVYGAIPAAATSSPMLEQIGISLNPLLSGVGEADGDAS